MALPPPSGALVAWSNAVVESAAALGPAVAELRGRFEGAIWTDGRVIDSGEALALCAAADRRVLVLPVPGDPTGLPPHALAAAMVAGEGVVLLSDERLKLLCPPGRGERWWVCSDHPLTAQPGSISVSEARRGLLAAMREAATELERLGLQRPDQRLRAALTDLHLRLSEQSLPARIGAVNAELIDRACVVLTVIDVALASEGASLTAGEAAARRAPLSEVSRAARTALVAAYSDPGTLGP